MMGDTPTNPKQLYGDKKPDLRLLPLSGQLAQWAAHKDGANKYGPFNWRTNPVEANTYINAAKRHLELFAAGEAFARDTGVSNLGAVMACCAILLDAELHGTLIDNRHKSAAECDALHLAEGMVQKLRKAQEERVKSTAKTIKEQIDALNWIKYMGTAPNLTGHRKIEVRYKHGSVGGAVYTQREYDVDPRCNDYGIDWHGVYSWRPVRD